MVEEDTKGMSDLVEDPTQPFDVPEVGLQLLGAIDHVGGS